MGIFSTCSILQGKLWRMCMYCRHVLNMLLWVVFAQAYALQFLNLFELSHNPCIFKLTTAPVGLLNPTTLNLAVSTTTVDYIHNNQCLFIVHASHELAGFSCLSNTISQMFLLINASKVHCYVPLNLLCMRYYAATTVFLKSVI